MIHKKLTNGHDLNNYESIQIYQTKITVYMNIEKFS